MTQYDLIVIGLGAVGSSTLFHAAKSQARVLGIDQFNPPHEFGSSHAETRMTRLSVPEGEQYQPIVSRSHQLWRELEAESGQELFFHTGGYFVTSYSYTDGGENHYAKFVERTIKMAKQADFEFELRPPAQVREHLPFLQVDDRFSIGYEASGGIIMCERAVTAHIETAKRFGAAVHVQERVQEVEYDHDHVTVITDKGRYTAGHVVLAAGAWIPGFLPPRQRAMLTVTRQIVYWFEVDNPAQFSVDQCPFVIWQGASKDDMVGVFPMPPNGTPGLKVVTEQFIETTDPSTVSRTVTQEEIDYFYHNRIKEKIHGVLANCVRASVCLYTHTPDANFAIDYLPESERVIIASACSGHGFKHSAALGEAIAQMAMTGQSDLDLSPFKLQRFYE